MSFQINDPEDFNLYFSLLSSMKKEVLVNLKYEIDISPLIDIKNETTLDAIKKLFNLISFKNIKPLNPKNIKKLVV